VLQQLEELVMTPNQAVEYRLEVERAVVLGPHKDSSRYIWRLHPTKQGRQYVWSE
jgi:hypothetical protein